jgi:hypothetical protein
MSLLTWFLRYAIFLLFVLSFCKTPHSRFFLKSSRQRQRQKVGVGDSISFFENWSIQTSDPTDLLSLCFLTGALVSDNAIGFVSLYLHSASFVFLRRQWRLTFFPGGLVPTDLGW